MTHLLLILALQVTPATAKPVPSNRVVYSCPSGQKLYRRVPDGKRFINEAGFYDADLVGTGILIDGPDAYVPWGETDETQADDRHFCISK